MAIERVLIIGAGSIGNHMAHAARSLKWEVTISDRDPEALSRTRDDIYPKRYGSWDEGIQILPDLESCTGEFDLVVVGTPPTTHLRLAREALAFNPKSILIEKPLTAPECDTAFEDLERLNHSGARIFIGYNHVVAKSVSHFLEVANSGSLGQIQEVEVRILEHWGGIFKAHPWLSGPAESYLGSWREGGGALSEHSHGLNLWQHIARQIGGGEASVAESHLRMRLHAGREYDESFHCSLVSEFGLSGTCTQDVITEPSTKTAKIVGSKGELQLTLSPNLDSVAWISPESLQESTEFPKDRASDFITELLAIDEALERGAPSALDLEWGMRTDKLITDVLSGASRTFPDEI